MPQKAWAVGEEVLAADFNTYMQNQVIPQFTNTAQRDSQWAAPPNGAVCVTVDTGTVWERIGGGWWPPFHRLAYVQTTSNQGPTPGTTEVVVNPPGATATVTMPTVSRLVRVEAFIRNSSGTAGDAAIYRIREGATTAGLQVVDGIATFGTSGPQIGNSSTLLFGRSYAPGAGARQWCLTVQGAANPVTANATAASPLWLQVTDLGAG